MNIGWMEKIIFYNLMWWDWGEKAPANMDLREVIFLGVGEEKQKEPTTAYDIKSA